MWVRAGIMGSKCFWQDHHTAENFEWNSILNATYNTSEVISLGDDVDGTFITVGTAEFHGELRQVVGKPMAQLYGWGYLRDNQGRHCHDP
jgi:hypothetical protein